MKRLSSPNLWRIRDSQPLQTMQNASLTNDNDEKHIIDTIRPEHVPHLESPLAKDEKLYVSKDIDHHDTDEAPKLLDNKNTVNNAASHVVNHKLKSTKKPLPSYMRFTEAYKRSKGLIVDEKEERDVHQHRIVDNSNKRIGHNTKALLGPKSAAGVNVRFLKNVN